MIDTYQRGVSGEPRLIGDVKTYDNSNRRRCEAVTTIGVCSPVNVVYARVLAAVIMTRHSSLYRTC